jgi:membrane protein DedA with SNARE-associated domain
MTEWAQTTLEFMRNNQSWIVPIVFALAFAESLAVVALLVPATVILWGAGALIGAADLNFWPIFLAAALGAGFGDWLSYWLGFHYHAQIARMWPLTKYPELLPKGHVFFEKWGTPGVFIGRFFGPLRAAVPLVAGACRMDQVPFQIANWSSAFIWAAVTLGPGAFSAGWLKNYLHW